MEASAQRPVTDTVEATELQHQQDGGAVEMETDGLVFKRELLNEFLANRVRS